MLFVFRPRNFGPMTYAVMAASEFEAREKVKAHYERENGATDHKGWGEIESIDHEDGDAVYEVDVYEAWQVFENDNG